MTWLLIMKNTAVQGIQWYTMLLLSTFFFPGDISIQKTVLLNNNTKNNGVTEPIFRLHHHWWYSRSVNTVIQYIHTAVHWKHQPCTSSTSVRPFSKLNKFFFWILWSRKICYKIIKVNNFRDCLTNNLAWEQKTTAQLTLNSMQLQCFLFSRNIGQLTLKIIYFHYLKESFLDQSIQGIFYLILKEEALCSSSQPLLVSCCLALN